MAHVAFGSDRYREDIYFNHHRHTDWADEDYMLAVEAFAMGKLAKAMQHDQILSPIS